MTSLPSGYGSAKAGLPNMRMHLDETGRHGSGPPVGILGPFAGDAPSLGSIR